MVPEQGLLKGNGVSLAISCNSQVEITTLYSKLSHGGSATHPPEETFWGGTFGDLIDKYGNQWLLSYEKKPA